MLSLRLTIELIPIYLGSESKGEVRGIGITNMTIKLTEKPKEKMLSFSNNLIELKGDWERSDNEKLFFPIKN